MEVNFHVSMQKMVRVAVCTCLQWHTQAVRKTRVIPLAGQCHWFPATSDVKTGMKHSSEDEVK